MLAAYRDAVPSPGKLDYGGGNRHVDGYLSLLDGSPDRLKPWQAVLHRDALAAPTRHWLYYAYTTVKTPYLLKAMAHLRLSEQRPTVVAPTGLPSCGRTALIAVREPQDMDIPVRLLMRPWKHPVLVKVYFEDGALVMEKSFEKPASATHATLLIPADGRARHYLIALGLGLYEGLDAPVTGLDKEVAIARPPCGVTLGKWMAASRYYFNCPGGGKVFVIPSDNGSEIVDGADQTVWRTPRDRFGMRNEVALPAGLPQPLSIVTSGATRFDMPAGAPTLFFALSPDSLFVPRLAQEPAAKR